VVKEVATHNYQVSHPHRLKAFEGALEHISGRSDVWLATGREIAQHYLDTSYDAAVAAIAAAGSTASREGSR
jgi:allantoinase